MKPVALPFFVSWVMFAVVAVFSVEAGNDRFVEVQSDFVAVYGEASDSLPPILMARKNERFPVFFSEADDSGRIWFCLSLGQGRPDSGWAPARFLRYVPLSPDSSFVLHASSKESRADKRRRHVALRKHRDWPFRVRKAVRKGEIILYMTEEQLTASWGGADNKANAFMVGIGVFEMLFYHGENESGTVCVTLHEDRVTGWSEK